MSKKSKVTRSFSLFFPLIIIVYESYTLLLGFLGAEYCEQYAKKGDISNTLTDDSEDELSHDDISDGRSESSEEDITGNADP